MAFDVQRQLVVEVTPEPDGRRVDLRTTGLALVGRRELRMRHIPEELATEAGTVLNLVSDYLANQRPILVGERFAVPHPWCALVVRLVGDERGQRVVDGFDPGDDVPWIALSTMLLWQAAAAEERGERQEAVAVLERSLAHTPHAVSDRPELDLPYNWGGEVAALKLAELDPVNAARWLREACDRSSWAAIRVLGDPLSGANEVDRAALRPIVRSLVETQRAFLNPQVDGPVMMFLGPLATPANGELALEVAVLPRTLADRLLAERVWTALLDPRVTEIAVELAWSCEPTHLVAVLWGATDLYGQSPQAVGTGLPWVTGTRLLSVILADVGRLVVGGAEVADLAAYYGLADDVAAMERVRAADAEFHALAQRALRF